MNIILLDHKNNCKKVMNNAAKRHSSNFLHNYFDNPTKLFSNL